MWPSLAPLKNLPAQEKQRALLLGLSYFLVLFAYAFLRPTINSLFIGLQGAEKTPQVLLAAANKTCGVFSAPCSPMNKELMVGLKKA